MVSFFFIDFVSFNLKTPTEINIKKTIKDYLINIFCKKITNQKFKIDEISDLFKNVLAFLRSFIYEADEKSIMFIENVIN